MAERNIMAENSEPNSEAERVVWTPGNLKRPVWKYFGFWSVDGKNVEPQDKVICKLCKLQLAYHSTTSNMRAYLKNCTQISPKPKLTRIFHHPPQALCLQHDKRCDRRNVLHSYARTWGWSVSLMARASESFVSNWIRGTVSWKYVYK